MSFIQFKLAYNSHHIFTTDSDVDSLSHKLSADIQNLANYGLRIKQNYTATEHQLSLVIQL